MIRRRVEDQLVGLGNIIEAARRKGLSLSSAERRMIDRVHGQAIEAGFSWSGINALEMEGERGLRGSMPFPIDSRFIGLQEGGPFGLKMRLYNIEGDHRLNNSTVGVSTLWRENIHVGDLSLVGVWFEVAKETFVIGYWYVASVWQVAEIKWEKLWSRFCGHKEA